MLIKPLPGEQVEEPIEKSGEKGKDKKGKKDQRKSAEEIEEEEKQKLLELEAKVRFILDGWTWVGIVLGGSTFAKSLLDFPLLLVEPSIFSQMTVYFDPLPYTFARASIFTPWMTHFRPDSSSSSQSR